MTVTASWQLAARQLALDAATVDAVDVLTAAGFDALLLKGPVTAARLYPEAPHRRYYTDIDLLVSPARFEAAEAALTEAGYRWAHAGLRTREKSRQEESWIAPGRDLLVIDLHRTLAFVEDAQALWRALWTDRVAMAIQGTPVAIPSRVGTAMIVALHAASPGQSRQPYRDLARAVKQFDEGEWSAAIDIARSVGAETAVAAGLNAVPTARPLLMRHGLEGIAIPTFIRMCEPDTSPAGLAIRRLMAVHGLRPRTEYLLSRVLPSEAAMRKNWRVRGPGHRALVRAHCSRYVLIVRSIPRGLAELRRARGASRNRRAGWASEAVDSVRQQLGQGGLDTVELAAPARTTTSGQVARALARRRATCLEGSLVRQRFLAARGRPRSLVIGVSPPDETFHAHAWLDGDLQPDAGMHEILRRPVPARWLSQS